MQDMGDEREHTENLLNQRFNFLIVFFSLVIAGALAAKSQPHFEIILTVGAVVCWLVSLTVFRCQQKFDIIFKKLPEAHPAKEVDKAAKPWPSMRWIIGYVIPSLCSVALTVGAVMAYMNLLIFAVEKSKP